jgi:hypothetical protein
MSMDELHSAHPALVRGVLQGKVEHVSGSDGSQAIVPRLLVERPEVEAAFDVL